MKAIRHKKCIVCLSVSITLSGRHMPSRGGFVCNPCAQLPRGECPPFLPTWEDPETHTVHYHVPSELQHLSEGEKLLIQIISPYVPLQHLRKGSFGCHGHVCSFVKDVQSVCTELPRKQVEAVKVIRHFKNDNGQLESKAFLIRKTKVLRALVWLCKHHPDYRDTVTINEANLDWMNGKEERELDVDIVLDDDDGTVADTQRDGSVHRSYGVLHNFHQDCDPKKKDDHITTGISDAMSQQRASARGTHDDSPTTMSFPYVSPDPVNEYQENLGLFRKAFPWLFPGGRGDITSREHYGSNLTIDKWMQHLLLYYDGRFARDKIWCFFALNVAQRRQNQKQGAYFVDGFFENGPKTLEDIQHEILEGNTKWASKIAYFGSRIRGSASYWRERRSEVYSWINHHIEKGNGAPSYFMTLSCAEYHWPDIKRLLQERYDLAGEGIPDITSPKGMSTYINEFTVVIQEYFQLRVKTWLETVAKDTFGINHYWLRFEFAPGRGQIHAHLLATTNIMKDVRAYVHDIQMGRSKFGHIDKPDRLCGYVLEAWARDNLGMTATSIPTGKDKPSVPARKVRQDNSACFSFPFVLMTALVDVSSDEKSSRGTSG